MRKVTLIYIFIFLFITSVVIANKGYLPSGYSVFVFFLLYISFVSTMNSNYFSEQPLGYALWVNPILDLMVVMVNLDNNVTIQESKRVKKYLDKEFDPFTSGLKFKYFKKQLKTKINVLDTLEILRDNSSSMEKMRIINELVKIALIDRLMSDKELLFITKVSKKLGLHPRTLKSILEIHTYITEEDIRNPKPNRVYVSNSLQKSYSILGLEQTATQKEVRDTYRELAKIYHPDKQRGSKESKNIARAQFQVIAQAYELIKNEKR